MQPPAFLFLNVGKNGFASVRRSEVYVCGFPPHGVQQAHFFTGRFQGCKFDTRTVRAEAADNPMTAELNEGVGTTNCTTDDCLVQNF